MSALSQEFKMKVDEINNHEEKMMLELWQDVNDAILNFQDATGRVVVEISTTPRNQETNRDVAIKIRFLTQLSIFVP